MTYPHPRPRIIVCICGSTRFQRELAAAALAESIAGRIVVAPMVDMKQPHPLWLDPADAERIKQDLDALHLDKIRLADEVLVVNPGNYIGRSTRREIEFSESIGKPVRYTVDPDTPPYDPERVADAIAGLRADTSNDGMIARFGDRIAELHDAVAQGRAEDAT